MNSSIIETIANFLDFVGIEVIKRPINSPVFLPGLLMENGKIVIDPEKLLYPGDILHEAGHIATAPTAERESMSDNLPDNDQNRGGEIMALAWSYAACLHLNLDPHFVFHADGYKGAGENIVENFKTGKYLGLPLLQWAGMAYDVKNAKENNALPFPHMIHWLRKT